MKRIFTIFAACLAALVLPAFAPAQTAVSGPELESDKDYYATFETTKGKIVFKLFAVDAPETVQNFVNLIEGTKPWKDPKSGETVKKPFYDNLTFHRVIPGFMIQGGCPLGTGTGSPGYRFKDEFQSGRKFNDPYLLAMANSGPNTNGSQFFITDKGSFPSHLNNRHTIYGQVIKGQDVVDAIAHIARGARDKPNTPVVIEKATVVRLSKGAKWGDSPASAPGAASKTPASKPATTPKPASKPASKPAR